MVLSVWLALLPGPLDSLGSLFLRGTLLHLWLAYWSWSSTVNWLVRPGMGLSRFVSSIVSWYSVASWLVPLVWFSTHTVTRCVSLVLSQVLTRSLRLALFDWLDSPVLGSYIQVLFLVLARSLTMVLSGSMARSPTLVLSAKIGSLTSIGFSRRTWLA
jgi:hypothetical protein